MRGNAGRLVKKLFTYLPDRRLWAAFASLRLVCFLDASHISSIQRLIQFRLRFLTSGRAIWFNERQESLFGSGWYGQGIPSNSETG